MRDMGQKVREYVHNAAHRATGVKGFNRDMVGIALITQGLQLIHHETIDFDQALVLARDCNVYAHSVLSQQIIDKCAAQGMSEPELAKLRQYRARKVDEVADDARANPI